MYLYGPAGLPSAIVLKLNGFATEASNEADFRTRGAVWSGQPMAISGAVLNKQINDEVVAWVSAAKAVGLLKQ